MAPELWKTPDYWVSHWNYAEPVTANFSIPSKVKIHDSTLRDGVQEPGVTITFEDAIRIAEYLAEIGVQRLETGNPMSPDDEKVIRELVKRKLNIEILPFCGMNIAGIEKAIDLGVKGLVMPCPASEYEINAAGQTFDKIAEGAIKATRFAHEHGLWVTLFTIDASRSEESQYINFVDKINKEGYFDALCVADTRGVLNPQAVFHLVKKLKDLTNKSIEIHVHNNFGLAVANTTAAVIAGSDVIHTSIDGIGASAGNCPLAEAAVALKTLYGVDTGIKYDKLFEITRKVTALLHTQLPLKRPLMGEMVFMVEVDRQASLQWKVEQQGKKFNMLDEHPLRPEWIGQAPGQKIAMGRKAGRANVEIWAREMNIALTEDEVVKVLDEVKKKSTELKRLITKAEFLEITKGIKGS